MGEPIAFEHEGTHVKGEIVTRSKRDITVEITEPYHGLKTGSHFPYLSYFGDADPSFLGEYGEQQARELIRELVDIGRTIDQNRAALQSELEKYQRDRQEIRVTIVFYRLLKQRLRKKFKNDDLTQREYQEELESIRDRVDRLNHQSRKLFDVYFQDYFDVRVSISTREDVLDQISKNP